MFIISISLQLVAHSVYTSLYGRDTNLPKQFFGLCRQIK